MCLYVFIERASFKITVLVETKKKKTTKTSKPINELPNIFSPHYITDSIGAVLY